MSDKKYFCRDCIDKGNGMALSEAEWMQHLASHPTHMAAFDIEEEDRDLKNLV